MTIKTKNFNPATDPKLLCTCGLLGCDRRSVNQNTLNRVQLVRDSAGRPLTITSGGRCHRHPSEEYRKTPADHQKGLVVDISVNGGVERAQIVTLGLKHGFNAIGIAKTFVHLGFRQGEQPVMWVY